MTCQVVVHADKADFNPYSMGGGYTGDFVVPGDWLRSLS